MNPWSIWTWPLKATLDTYQRALELISDGMGASGERDTAGVCDEPEWATPNSKILDLSTMRLRDFSVAKNGRHPAIVVTPFALHDAALADLAPGHSLIETLLLNGCSRLFLVEWKSATPEMRLHTIDSHLAALNVAVDDIGAPVELIGLCQGGWLSLVYAARFPKKVRKLVLAGAPIDMMVETSALSTPASPMSDIMIDEMIRLGDGLVLGRYMAAIWPRELDHAARIRNSLQLDGPPTTEAKQRAAAIFTQWDCRALDLPGLYYRQVFDWLFRENRLATGTFPALGRLIDLHKLKCPLFLLAGVKDLIAPPAQVFAAATLIDTHESDIEKALASCGHLALFMGQRTLAEEWPRIAQWLAR